MDFTGAPYLSAMAAARVGAGTVKLFVARTIHPILAGRCVEVMVGALPEAAPGVIGGVSREAVEANLARATVGVVGPGLGQAGETQRLVQEIVTTLPMPLVVDADGLNALSAARGLLPSLGAGGRIRVLTPHPGEMARLLDVSTKEVQADREALARRAAREWGAVVVLKGAGTVVAAPDGRTATDPHSVPALATGGTGDVLSGVIGGLLAQRSEPFEAAVTGVWVHAATGLRLQHALGSAGVLASDLLPLLPTVLRDLRAESDDG
jgi:NAD(P)H-hydrate epimerase